MKAWTICLLALASCSSSAAASKPIATTTLPYADIVAVQLYDKDGVFIEMRAFRDILTGIEVDKGELRNAAAQAVAGKEFYHAQSEELKKIAAQQVSRAAWLPLIGAGAGAVGVGLVWALFEGIKAAVAAGVH